MEEEPRAKYVGRISYAAVELCGRGHCDMRGWGIWLLASQEPGEVNEPPPRCILFPSTTITHAESTNQERKQHRDSENKPTGLVSLDVVHERVLLSVSTRQTRNGERNRCQ